MAYTLKQAATAVGRSKPTVLRAIQAGRISAVKDALGGWQIDPAELHRVYAPVTVRNGSDNGTRNAAQHTDSPNVTVETALLRSQVDNLRSKLEAFEVNREHERRRADETIADLRQRLNQMTALLLDQRRKQSSGSVPDAGSVRRRWQWWLRGR